MSDFGLQLKAKKCTFMQTKVAFLGHIVSRTGLACDPEKLAAVRNWHEPNRVKAVRQFVGFVGYYCRFVRNFAELADPLVALTRKGVPFVWADEQQTAFDALKACLLSAPILGYPTENDRFVLDTDASLFAIGGVLSQIQNEEEVVIAYASRSLRISQRRYCTGTRFRTVTDVARASGPAVTEAGGPVIAGTRFLAVAEVYAPFEETEGDRQGDDRKVDQNSNTPEEDAGSRPLEHSGVKEGGHPEHGMNEFDCTAQEEEIVCHPLEHSGVVEWAGVSDELKKRSSPESFEIRTDPTPVRKALEEEPIEHSASNGTTNGGSEPLNTDVQEETEDGEAIIVGAVGSAAPWFLTGWTNEVEVEFMIDTGCQVTILATSVFEKMCTAHPQVRSTIRPCMRWLVSADSSPLTVIGKIDLDVVFPGLKCSMSCVVVSIGSDGLLGTEALQLCLPHQLDLRTGLLWAEGRSTLQLHQQKPTPDVRGLFLTAVVLPPEVVAPFSLNGGQLGSCALIVPDRDLTEEFGVVVGHTLVDASASSANVLIINPNAEEVVLPCRTSIGQLVLISAVSVARSEIRLPTNTVVVLPEYLEDIVKGSHTSLGDTGRQSLRELGHRYGHVFPAPGEPVNVSNKIGTTLDYVKSY